MPSAVLPTLFSLLILLALRLLYILPLTHHTVPPAASSKRNVPKHLMVLLGSGGHTAEMLLLLASLTPAHTRSFKRTYIVTSGDSLSISKAAAHEQTLRYCDGRCVIRVVPRARRVGQSWISTPWDCARCLVGCVQAFAHGGVPDVVLCNGPGSAVLMVMVALGARFLGLATTRCVYVESFARTRSLSLSGRILYPLVDRFFVQWPKVKDRYPRAEYRGVLV